jgi:hypothetical protein
MQATKKLWSLVEPTKKVKIWTTAKKVKIWRTTKKANISDADSSSVDDYVQYPMVVDRNESDLPEYPYSLDEEDPTFQFKTERDVSRAVARRGPSYDDLCADPDTKRWIDQLRKGAEYGKIAMMEEAL